MMLFCRGGLNVYEMYNFKASRFSIVTLLTFKVALMIEIRTWVRANWSNIFLETYILQSETQIRFDSV